MQREIKFRFWCKGTSTNLNFAKSGWWSYPNFILNKYYDNFSIFESEDFIPCQFTGLTDKNGNLIYECDIIDGVCLNDGPQICVVGFDTFGIYYTKIAKYPSEPYENCACLAQEYSKIVGNIFENPELIKN